MASYGSILAADFGSVHTRVVLIDVVEGVYRMVARAEGRTTAGFPLNNIAVGLAQALEDLSSATGRSFLTPAGEVLTPEQPDRSGVDVFVMTASMGRPLRTVLVGLVPSISLESGLRAASGTYVDVVETLSLDDRRSEEDLLNAIILSHPDLIFITGGTEDGARTPLLRLARIAQLAVRVMDERRRPAVLYAGNSANVAAIQDLFAGTPLFVSPNVRPSLDEEQLENAQLQLALAFNRQKAQSGADFNDVVHMSRQGVLPTAQSYNLIVDYLGKTTGRSVLALDVGSSVSTLSISLDGNLATSIRTDIGVGHSAPTLLHRLGADALRRWLPFNVARGELVNYTANKTLRPQTVPETLRDVYLEHALLRAGVQRMVQDARPTWRESARTRGRALLPEFGMVIGAGAALTQTGNPGYSALLLLDALQPVGVGALYTDPYALIASLGALALVNQEAVVQVLEGSNLERLGAMINVSGTPRPGRPALRLKITTEDGSVTRHTVEGGTLWVFPLPVGQYALVEVSAQGGVTVGGKGRMKFTAEGGTAGLIFDARGRPLPVAVGVQERAAQFAAWVSQMTGDLKQEFDPKGFEDVVEAETQVVVAAKPGKAPRTRPEKPARPAPKGKAGGKAAAPPPEETDTAGEDLRALLEQTQGKKKKK